VYVQAEPDFPLLQAPTDAATSAATAGIDTTGTSTTEPDPASWGAVWSDDDNDNSTATTATANSSKKSKKRKGKGKAEQQQQQQQEQQQQDAAVAVSRIMQSNKKARGSATDAEQAAASLQLRRLRSR
jgi:hypothetical protein